MALILSIETSTSICSVALHQSGVLLAHLELHETQAHAAKLGVLIQKVMDATGKRFNELEAVAVAAGPGSYTGLRIGTSTAKGLCYALNVPLIAVVTLDVMANEVKVANVFNALCCPMIDARRMEVYCSLHNAHEIVLPVQAKIIDETSFQDFLEQSKIMFFGNGADKCSDIIRHKNAIFVDNIYPQAASLGRLAYLKFLEGEFEQLVAYEPLYMKEFVVKKSLKSV